MKSDSKETLFSCCLQCYKAHKEECERITFVVEDRSESSICKEEADAELVIDEDNILSETFLQSLKSNKKILDFFGNSKIKKIVKQVIRSNYRKEHFLTIYKENKEFAKIIDDLYEQIEMLLSENTE